MHGENGGREAEGFLQVGVEGREGEEGREGGSIIWEVRKKDQVGIQGLRDGWMGKGLRGLDRDIQEQDKAK